MLRSVNDNLFILRGVLLQSLHVVCLLTLDSVYLDAFDIVVKFNGLHALSFLLSAAAACLGFDGWCFVTNALCHYFS